MGFPPMAIPPDLMGNVERYAVYRCFSDAGELLYVGESGNLAKRLAVHAQKAWFLQVRGITLEWHIDELDALNAERRAIHVEHPRYNVVHRNSATLQSVKPSPPVLPSPPAPPRPPRAPRARRNDQVRRRTSEETQEMALALMRAEPNISGSEIGRRLGTTPGYGRTLVRRIAGEQKESA